MAKTTIPAGYFAAGSIATADLADDAITSAKIADNAITAAMVPNATALTLDGGLTVDNITINGTEIDLSSGDLTVDVAGNLILAPGSDEVRLIGGSNDTAFGKFFASSGNFYINMPTQDKDIIFSGNDGGTTITAMTIDMSEGGKVGIGTASPTVPLHISSTGHTQYQQHRQSSSVSTGQELALSFDTANGTEEIYGTVYSEISSNTDGAETGKIALRVADAGTLGYVIKGDGGGDTTLYADGDAVMTLKDGGNVGIGTTNPASQLTLSAATPTIHLIDSDNNADAYIQGTDGNIKFYADDSGEASSSEITFALDGTQRAKIDADGDFTATNVYAGATGSETQIVNFPNTSTYPNVSTYTFSLTASQAPLGSRVIMGIRISSGSHGGDQYMYLDQNNVKGPKLMQFVDSWYYNDGAMSMYKIDATGDRNFTVSHGTIVATNSNDWRRVYYYGYIMDN